LVRVQRWKAGKTLEAEEVLWWLKGDFFLEPLKDLEKQIQDSEAI
jgi:hypothetical protein